MKIFLTENFEINFKLAKSFLTRLRKGMSTKGMSAEGMSANLEIQLEQIAEIVFPKIHFKRSRF